MSREHFRLRVDTYRRGGAIEPETLRATFTSLGLPPVHCARHARLVPAIPRQEHCV